MVGVDGDGEVLEALSKIRVLFVGFLVSQLYGMSGVLDLYLLILFAVEEFILQLAHS